MTPASKGGLITSTIGPLNRDERYKDFPYKEFHKYIARKMTAFYKRHGFPATKASKVVQEPDESQELNVGDVVALEGGGAINKSYTMSDGSSDDDEEEGAAGGAAPAPPEAPAAGGAEPAPADAAAA